MMYSIARCHPVLPRRVVALLLAAVALCLTAATASAQACYPVVGHYVEQSVAQNPCEAPAQICRIGEYSGVLRGSFATTVTEFLPESDSNQPPIALFRANSTIQAQVHGKQGGLTIRNGGAFKLDSGEILDLQVLKVRISFTTLPSAAVINPQATTNF